MNLFKNFFKISFNLALVLLVATSAFASEEDGVVDVTNKYAKVMVDDSQISFGTSQSTISITDSAITGYAWSENYGWINMNPTNGGITISSDGVLTGYAWGETMGWINFNPTNAGVSINEDGEFTGHAWSENHGWIEFDCTDPDACLSTDFRAEDFREEEEASSGGGGGGGGPSGPSSPTTPTPTPEESEEETPTPVEPVEPTVPEEEIDEVLPEEEPEEETPLPEPEELDPPTFPEEIDSPDDSNPTLENIADVFSGLGDVVNNLRNQTDQIFDISNIIISETRQEIAKVIDNPTGDAITKTVSSVGIAAGASVTIASTLFLNPLSISELLMLPVRLWALLMSALGIRKRHRPWGTVYDSITKQPLDPAYVVLQDQNGNEITTSITDIDGRYGFLASGGTYKMIANKTNYTFPSKKLQGKERDEIYGDLYFGENLNLAPGEVINKNIPLDPDNFDWNEFEKTQKKLTKFYSKRLLIFSRISEIAFNLGFLVAVVSLYVIPKPYNAIIFFIYLIMLAVRKFGAKSKAKGTVIDNDGIPLSFAIVKIYQARTDNEFMKKITDKVGKFFALVPNGDYYLKIEKKNSDETYTRIYTTPVFKIEKGVIDKKILIPENIIINNENQMEVSLKQEDEVPTREVSENEKINGKIGIVPDNLPHSEN